MSLGAVELKGPSCRKNKPVAGTIPRRVVESGSSGLSGFFGLSGSEKE
jgi:hypothetical protein